MITPYVQNYLGFTLTEDDYQDCQYPYAELYTHVTLKTLQVGTTFATVLFGPLIALGKKTTRNTAGISSKISKAGKIGGTIGLLAGPAMTYNRIKDQPYEKVYDRSYRLRKNRSQIEADRGYIGGSIVGLAAAVVFKSNPFVGMLVGSSVGIISVGAKNNLM